jgi:DNA-binding winged helix-turn-helix (wHTH) protein
MAVEPIRVGAAQVDLADGRVRAPDGTEIELRPQSAAVLRALAARRGETVSKDMLFDEVWGNIAVTEDSLVQCIGDIRRTLGPARDAVQTVAKRGYRLAADRPRTRRPAGATLRAAVAVLVLGLIAALGWAAFTRPPPCRSWSILRGG